MDKKYSDTFLARWLNNELTNEEKKNFEASDDFLCYKKIAEKSTELSTPEFKKNNVFNNIHQKIHQKDKNKVKPLYNSLKIYCSCFCYNCFWTFLFSKPIREIYHKCW